MHLAVERFFVTWRRRAEESPDGKQLLSPMDTRNIRRVIALSAGSFLKFLKDVSVRKYRRRQFITQFSYARQEVTGLVIGTKEITLISKSRYHITRRSSLCVWPQLWCRYTSRFYHLLNKNLWLHFMIYNLLLFNINCNI